MTKGNSGTPPTRATGGQFVTHRRDVFDTAVPLLVPLSGTAVGLGLVFIGLFGF